LKIYIMFLSKGICHSNIENKCIYRYKKLRSELVYRIEFTQRAGLGAGTKWIVGTKDCK
jgi:hypothetical protein